MSGAMFTRTYLTSHCCSTRHDSSMHVHNTKCKYAAARRGRAYGGGELVPPQQLQQLWQRADQLDALDSAALQQEPTQAPICMTQVLSRAPGFCIQSSFSIACEIFSKSGSSMCSGQRLHTGCHASIPTLPSCWSIVCT